MNISSFFIALVLALLSCAASANEVLADASGFTKEGCNWTLRANYTDASVAVYVRTLSCALNSPEPVVLNFQRINGVCKVVLLDDAQYDLTGDCSSFVLSGPAPTVPPSACALSGKAARPYRDGVLPIEMSSVLDSARAYCLPCTIDVAQNSGKFDVKCGIR